MNIRNESRSGSLFFGLKANKGSIKQMFVSGSPRTNVRFLGAGAGHAWISCRSYAIRPGALYEQAFAAGDTPGSVGRGAGAARGRTNTRAKIRLFFYFFSLPLYHRSGAVVKCFLENFFKKFSIFLLTCAGVSWYNVYVNGKGKENWLSRKKLEKVKKILDFSS